MTVIKAGIIGTGFQAVAHLEAAARLPNVEIIAIAGSTLEKAEQIGKQYHIPKAYGDAEELIHDPDVEVVHNCTPNYLHFPINRSALTAGKHLLAEKPLAMDSQESEMLVRLAAEQGVLAGVCFNYRYYPLIREARELIYNQNYGSPFLVYGGYTQDWCLYKTDYSWRMDPDKNGKSRAIADIGSHWCDTIQTLLGKKIVKVFADLKTVHPVRKKPENSSSTFSEKSNNEGEEVAITTEDYGSVIVHFEDGIQGVFTVSQVSAGRKNNFYFDIAMEEATLAWNQEEPNRLWIGKRNEPNKELVKDPALLSDPAAAFTHYPGGHQEGWPDGLKNLLLDFYQEVDMHKKGKYRSEASYFPTIQDGHNIMRLIDCILESHRTKQWVEVIGVKVR